MNCTPNEPPRTMTAAEIEKILPHRYPFALVDKILDYIPNHGRAAQVEYAMSDSLGFGGHNACVVFKRWEG